jgi:putative membrane protein insertion efficiency factor
MPQWTRPEGLKEKMSVTQASLDRRTLDLPAVVGRFLWHLPRNILIVVLKTYRRFISPAYGQVCRFFPSCSAYALEAVTVHGAVKGSWYAARRVARCHPWNAGGLDPVPSPVHVHWDEPSSVPLIVQLNHPDYFLAAQAETQSRTSASGE